MKSRVVLYFLILSGLIIVTCTRDDSPEGKRDLVFIESQPGGCNGVEFGEMKVMVDEPDTVYFKIRNDTLDAFVGINYICCAPFDTETRISGDSIFMLIKDTCPDPMSCYCKCMCYYSWDFLFTDVEDRDYFYRVTLDSPLEEGPRVLWEGTGD
jgi:hypothetical protein